MSWRTIGPVVVLTAIWAALWDSLSPGTLLGGVAVSVALLAAFPLDDDQPSLPRVRPFALLHLLAVFAKDLVVSSAQVVKAVLVPGTVVREAVVAVPLVDAGDGIVALVANAITLTPGTVTIEVERHPTTVYVHVLDLDDPDRVRADVQRFERLAMRAFGHPVPEQEGRP